MGQNLVSSLKLALNKDEKVLNRGSSLKTGDNKDENWGRRKGYPPGGLCTPAQG